MTAPLARWGELDRAARHAAYDNAAAVADSSAYMTRLRVRSAELRRRGLPGQSDVAYAPGARTLWHLYPAGHADAPCLIFIHGGYWQMNAPEGFACLVEGVRAHGWSVVMVGHTLAPEASLTRIVAEIDMALTWLDAHGPAHGFSGARLLAGWSAGGTLTGLCLAHRAVTAGLAISGVYELGPLRDTRFNTALQLTDQEVATLSPLRLPPCGKPMAIAYGSRELPTFCHDSITLHHLRARQHCPGPLVPLAGADHFTVLDSLAHADGELVRVARMMLDQASA
ncbi:putative arylformamidase [Gluconacetobacter sp. SXCC-1]|uniref:Alpha/beta hydrolase n=1 Tax=Komagataeibacter rhaeticus TaxID=215221 RepID=A0A181CE98_9PROT|nr:alpha/beta hydrolase [Komagataeibacter rhaeticus]ATU71480.1 alpha/beta hydrolase [Komagataeibacter xylinus]EGG78030.1 putative arylformamidase [Gluconacetobacter sp. SXCC-1]QIP36455.1 alpha/beta hydrolase [Komagataeibacter rhaeticus]QOC46225.1 alpha/beta hydrolase [Komagataeibacter rhaeticus]WPP21141.1 alpha/beta hydrolase [Komagataeibacter rhaeticus]